MHLRIEKISQSNPADMVWQVLHASQTNTDLTFLWLGWRAVQLHPSVPDRRIFPRAKKFQWFHSMIRGVEWPCGRRKRWKHTLLRHYKGKKTWILFTKGLQHFTPNGYVSDMYPSRFWYVSDSFFDKKYTERPLKRAPNTGQFQVQVCLVTERAISWQTHLSLVLKAFGSLMSLVSWEWTNRNTANRHLELPGNRALRLTHVRKLKLAVPPLSIIPMAT